MRILHLPNDIAGQLALTSQFHRKQGFKAVALSSRHLFSYAPNIDLVLPSTTYRLKNRLWRLLFFLKTCESFDVYHYYYGSSLLPFFLDALYESSRGKRVLVEFLGSDARLPDIELRRNPYYVNSYLEDEYKNRTRLKHWSFLTKGEAIFPDHTFNAFLRPYFHTIHIVGQRVDCSRLLPCYPKVKDGIVRVLHAPSQQAFKGTMYLEKAVESLLKKGVKLEYIRVEGKSHAEALALYKTADLIVDQLCGGSHGVFACEAMALGKPVVCYILEEHISSFPEGFPIINANPDTIEEVLEEWVQSPEKLIECGKKGRDYAERVHDAPRIAENLIRIYRKNFNPSTESVIDWRGK